MSRHAGPHVEDEEASPFTTWVRSDWRYAAAIAAAVVGCFVLGGAVLLRDPQPETVTVTEPGPTVTVVRTAEVTTDQVLDGWWWVEVQRQQLTALAADPGSAAAARAACARIDADPQRRVVNAEATALEAQGATVPDAWAWVTLAVETFCPQYGVLGDQLLPTP